MLMVMFVCGSIAMSRLRVVPFDQVWLCEVNVLSCIWIGDRNGINNVEENERQHEDDAVRPHGGVVHRDIDYCDEED
jgi:hypothetical protein